MSGAEPVELVDLRRAYGDRVAVDGVTLSVRAGELFGFQTQTYSMNGIVTDVAAAGAAAAPPASESTPR